MAADGPTENFQGRARFFAVGNFWKKFFQNVQHNIVHPNIQLGLFSSYGRGTQKRAQNPKSGFQNEKNDTKVGITRVCQELQPKKWC